jgi:hypothetical protein
MIVRRENNDYKVGNLNMLNRENKIKNTINKNKNKIKLVVRKGDSGKWS